MKIIILGIGGLGSHLCENLVADNRGQWDITVMDFDKVEERNLRGTQKYVFDQLGQLKTEALQYTLYRTFEKEIKVITQRLIEGNVDLLSEFDLVIDTFDNFESRKLVQNYCTSHNLEVIHIGFNPVFTFSIEFGNNYKVPTDIISPIDICEAVGASSFITMVSSVGSLVIQDFLKTGTRREFVGNRLAIREIK